MMEIIVFSQYLEVWQIHIIFQVLFGNMYQQLMDLIHTFLQRPFLQPVGFPFFH